ncbi:hypothetical protein P171DRAFT_442783 [Karstenula rhodostoma CBS 690.94]|uniref:CRIB domain-containing protein n=1 Tax=Karstenula rhodostoma CBS 690.94 TaxID=1392251 RepID=A0A9P4PLU7_9PLEO|nr:hypothetical protein P171DRAFT_442783 [Karstenula rhodostoma CBS 690.94]
MFASQKNNVFTASTQSSVDSLVTSRSTSTSVSDVGASQSSEHSSYGDPHSPEQRIGPLSGRRHSVFTLRSRSNTATSTASFASPSSPNMDASSSRSLFRSKKGKRLSGSSSHAHEHDEPQVATRRSSMLRKSKKQIDQAESSAQTLKSLISSPFGFQHLTHTNRQHFAALEEATENELAVGFSAVRASQAPRRNLNGIKAQDLHSSDGSEEDLAGTERRSTSAMELRPPPDFIDHVIESQEPAASPESSMRPSLRQTRSVESFSRPGVNARTHRHTQSANPPPRGSSRLPAANHDAQDTVTMRTNRQSGVWDNVAPLSPTRIGGLLPSMAEEPDYVGHALTTPDDSAIHPFTPPFSPALEDVAEEPERFVSPRAAPLPPNKSPKSPRSPSHASFSFSQRSPVAKSHARRDSHVLPKQLNIQNAIGPVAPTPEALASPGLSRKYPIKKPPNARRKSNKWRVIEESWEDDIDYIYDNALEAECELDWDGNNQDRDRALGQQAHRQATATPSKPSAGPSPVFEDEPPLTPGLFAGNFRASLLVPTMHNVPELEPRSAVSSSTTSVQTPSDYFNPQGPFGEAGRFSFAPSILGSAECKEQIPREDMYDNLVADYEGCDKHFPLLEPTRSVASSTLSSHARTSKCSSYDSSLMSSGHGSGSWTSGIRRSVGSAGSLPELVHSARTTRQDLSTVADKLSEDMGLFALEHENDGEDHEKTPPGHAQERTFFASGDEDKPANSAQTTLNLEMRTSLELARQGSTDSSSRFQTQHKYTSSDGAAKLLASNSTTRSRAGSMPQKSRGQYLSLFPTPPNH